MLIQRTAIFLRRFSLLIVMGSGIAAVLSVSASLAGTWQEARQLSSGDLLDHSRPAAGPQDKQPVNLQAQQLSHDDKTQTVTAIGDVELVQGDRIIRADKMVYNLSTDTVEALGNVSVLDEDGTVHFAQYIHLRDGAKEGFVQGLLSFLADGSRFTTTEAKREGGVKTTMKEVTYTPCKVCEVDPHPLWQIKADQAVHNQETKDIDYTHARLELAGVPLLYTPIFSHADPTVRRRSGFLRPRYGWSSTIGTFVEGGYYRDIAPDKDATLLVRPTTLEGTLLQGQWRQRFEDGHLEINGSTARADRKETDGHVESGRQRGHVALTGLFDINDMWRSGFNVIRASDKMYMRLYDISKANIVQNDVYAERFSGRDYSRVAVINVQDLRLGLRPEQANVLPLVEHHMVGEPRSLMGGRWSADFSAADLSRSGSGQDVQKVSLGTGWKRPYIFSATGISSAVYTDVMGDVYAIEDREAAISNPALSNTTHAVRGKATFGLLNSYPVVRRFEDARAVIEPVIGGDVATRVSNDANHFPNEDSVNVELDANNLFAGNRFPGGDRQEDGARVVYGLKSGLYVDDGKYARTFVGQSYRFKKDAIFPEGSGLEDQSSDIVGQVSAGLSRYFSGDYRIQVDNRHLSVQRHELQVNGGNDFMRAYSRYIYLGPVAGTELTESREQMQFGGSYDLTKRWTLSGYGLEDLGDQPGLRKGSMGLSYQDECFSFSVDGTRNNTTESSGLSETILMMRIGLKNIGEFEAPQISLSGGKQGN